VLLGSVSKMGLLLIWFLWCFLHSSVFVFSIERREERMELAGKNILVLASI
jgi:cbb3-type cytochrome oxidase subunit 3